MDGWHDQREIRLIVDGAAVPIGPRVDKMVGLGKSPAQELLVLIPGFKPREACVALEEDKVPTQNPITGPQERSWCHVRIINFQVDGHHCYFPSQWQPFFAQPRLSPCTLECSKVSVAKRHLLTHPGNVTLDNLWECKGEESMSLGTSEVWET
jgi:hypothetical protein